MKLETVSKKKAKIKMALQGPSGSGKTYSALLIAYGITQNWSSIAVIDTENHAASLYAHLGKYNILNLSPPFTPEKFIQAIQTCVSAGMQAIIIDSITHEWESIIDMHASMSGNSFTNWSKLTPRHNQFVQSMLQSDIHVIATIRAKQDYVLQEKNGKQVPDKVGLKAITREGMDYEFTIVLDIDCKHQCTASKDRTQLFTDKLPFVANTDTGYQILQWCQDAPAVDPVSLESQIDACTTMMQLIELYGKSGTELQISHRELFSNKKEQLTFIQNQTQSTHHGNPITNHSTRHSNP